MALTQGDFAQALPPSRAPVHPFSICKMTSCFAFATLPLVRLQFLCFGIPSKQSSLVIRKVRTEEMPFELSLRLAVLMPSLRPFFVGLIPLHGTRYTLSNELISKHDRLTPAVASYLTAVAPTSNVPCSFHVSLWVPLSLNPCFRKL